MNDEEADEGRNYDQKTHFKKQKNSVKQLYKNKFEDDHIDKLEKMTEKIGQSKAHKKQNHQD